LTEANRSEDGTNAPQFHSSALGKSDLETIIAVGRKRAETAARLRDAVLSGDTTKVFQLAAEYCGIET
jgi:hypothetical protein